MSKNIRRFLALGIICVVLAIGAFGAIAYYNMTVNAEKTSNAGFTSYFNPADDYTYYTEALYRRYRFDP